MDYTRSGRADEKAGRWVGGWVCTRVCVCVWGGGGEEGGCWRTKFLSRPGKFLGVLSPGVDISPGFPAAPGARVAVYE